MSRFKGETTDAARIRDLEKRVEALERRQPPSLSFSDGTRVRVRIGRQDDGKFGLRVWTSAGALTIDYTTS